MSRSWSRREGNRSAGRRLLIAFAVSVVLQVPILMIINSVIQRSVSDMEFARPGLDMELLFEQDRQKRLAEDFEDQILDFIADPVEEVEELDYPDEIVGGTEMPIGQIVSVIPPLDYVPPDEPYEARYSSWYAMKVDEEIKALEAMNEDKVPPMRHAERVVRPQLPASRKGGPTDGADRSPGESELVADPSESHELDEHRAVDERLGEAAGLFDAESLFEQRLDGIDPLEKYMPSMAPYASDDYISDVDKEGETNALNTVPFRYMGFFERVKNRVRPYWDPNSAYRLHDPTGEMYGHKDRLTIVNVVLDSRGYVLDTTYKDRCGLKFLDEEARDALLSAGPFLNPPEDLVGQDGKIRFEFGFAFLVASSRHRFFWRLQ